MRSSAAVALLTAVLLPVPAQAAPNAGTPYPVFTGDANPVPDQRTGFRPGNQLRAVFDADVRAGAGSAPGNDFWIDRMLARTGNQPGGGNGDANRYLFSRGRSVFMKTHEPGTLGFGGEVAYIETLMGGQGAYTIAVGGVTLTEDPAQRRQTPSYWRGVFTGGGLRVEQTKYITEQNVAVTDLTVAATDATARDVTLTAASPIAALGSVRAFNNLTTVFPRFSGDGFGAVDGGLRRVLSVPAAGSVRTKVQLGFVVKELPASAAEYERFRALRPAAAFTRHVTAYNRWWAENVPYLDTPEDNIDKTLFYRWWLMRFNFLDADLPGNDYQFPTAMEGVLGYNNAIVLTTGMFVDDLKYFRDPARSYGSWISAGEVAKRGKYVDNPGDPANWNNSYTQYISEAGWRSYQLHGGPAALAGKLARYAEDDVKGLQDAYDLDGNGLIEYNWGAMTGNDADAVSFHWRPGHLDRTESAYLYSNARASAAAYRVAGDSAKAAELEAFASRIKTAVLQHLWEPRRESPDEMGHHGNLLKHRHVATNGLVPWKEINNYYPFSVGLMPKPGEADYTQPYVEALRLFADDEQYPIFPFTTANQADKKAAAEQGEPGSNNFSVINATVTFRMLSSVLRNYPNQYIDAEWYKKLLYWNAWAHYQNNGDNRYPDQNEFWADGSAGNGGSIGYRSWIHHTILGATNFTVIEDAMGLRPRSDAKIELDPIDVGWDHFAADNIRYRDKDLTVVWDEPGGARHYGRGVPEGYSVFLDGRLAFTADKLGKLVYDPATGRVTADPGVTIRHAARISVKAPQDVRFAGDERVSDVLAKAGVSSATDVARTATATFGDPSGAVDGTTVNEPFWGTAGSPSPTDTITVDLGGRRSIDDVRVHFYRTSTTATVPGYAPPAQFTVEYDNGRGWAAVPGQSRHPAYPRGNLNQVRFTPVTATRLRITVQHTPGSKTAIKEIQAYATGARAPRPANAPPLADAWLDSSYRQAGSVRLIGLAQDDGTPGTPVTARWSVVSAPAEGVVAFEQPDSPTTVARFTVSGRYTVRLTVGASTRDVVVDATALSEGEINVAATATASADFTAGWNNVAAVNDGKPPLFTGGAQTDLWGTWTGSEPATRWLQYDFPAAVRVDRASIDFWSDSTTGGSGVAVPSSWQLQWWDGAAWQDVTGATGFDPAVAGRTNEVTFDPVTTTRLRAAFRALPDAAGTAYSAVGVSEWRVYAAAASAIPAVDVRTRVGVVPELPATVEVTYADGARLPAAVTWGQIDPARVSAVGDFTVPGFVAGTTLTATAHVWVRGADPVQINTVDPVRVTTRAGVAPALPAGVTVGYNDGSRQSGIAVTWEAVDPSRYASAGTFEVTGQVAGTDKAATATVVVRP